MEITLRDEGPVAIITWNDGENRVNLDSLARLNELLDEIEGRSGPLAVVLTGTGKFFSNGLDLDRFLSNADEMGQTFTELKRTVGRIFVLPAYTVAAVNGHAFAAGAAISLGFDYRVMREDRGYWCMNEVEIGLPLDEELFSILRHRLPFATAVHAALTAERYGGSDAVDGRHRRRDGGQCRSVATGYSDRRALRDVGSKGAGQAQGVRARIRGGAPRCERAGALALLGGAVDQAPRRRESDARDTRLDELAPEEGRKAQGKRRCD